MSDIAVIQQCRYTFGTSENSANRTFVNIKERQGFIIAPFTASIANQAVAVRCTAKLLNMLFSWTLHS